MSEIHVKLISCQFHIHCLNHMKMFTWILYVVILSVHGNLLEVIWIYNVKDEILLPIGKFLQIHKNCVDLCNRNHDSLIPDAPELLGKFLEGEQDMACKSNAFMMLIHADQVKIGIRNLNLVYCILTSSDHDIYSC